MKTCECQCNCGHEATMTDDSGVPVCEECSSYTVTTDGDVVCSRQTDGFETCHICGEAIDWGRILTGQSGSGSPNYRVGSCNCGDAWLDEDRGGWGHYRYGLETAAEEAQ